jgi:hypothetical protein
VDSSVKAEEGDRVLLTGEEIGLSKHKSDRGEGYERTRPDLRFLKEIAKFAPNRTDCRRLARSRPATPGAMALKFYDQTWIREQRERGSAKHQPDWKFNFMNSRRKHV